MWTVPVFFVSPAEAHGCLPDVKPCLLKPRLRVCVMPALNSLDATLEQDDYPASRYGSQPQLVAAVELAALVVVAAAAAAAVVVVAAAATAAGGTSSSSSW
jgi:hypothetical protein